MSNERPVNPSSSPLTEGLKRKRGRPKKQPREEAGGQLLVKKPRGRPKGSKKASTVIGQMVEPPAGKRPRGRPRKWPQLAIREGTSEEGSPQGSSDLNLNSAPATQALSGENKEPARTEGEMCQTCKPAMVQRREESFLKATCITGKDGSRPSKTTGLRKSLSNIPATAQ
ncbi:uncharacterized protein [Anas platyrhynchos]|uniref:uncharacterized protein isoform X1 n=1 Tax=Anas platyrhynchos TaxID=8839 RepID=UPI000F7CA2C1|nr:origin recognition complex subunit 4-like isoform X1 [Anas platyrhynchos]XP_021135232.2 origin recognition complex subunit 4-like isoform X1 [Anas platyrhynchos]XP_021135233.2 origin recognition complex subunit 4-like isoform X1 [Anas platyrhynchos]XP_038042001.1 origin recognition complex subunit 4-like isoform X1 [Anas platyrhynchos]|eukprot:XP_021135231.2 origin recognition complex subunit 4-like isoform X1 [Anas platyrhynchos]